MAKLERVVAYKVGDETITNRAEAKVAQVRQELTSMLGEASVKGGELLVSPLSEDDVAQWMLNNARTLSKLLNAYIKNKPAATEEPANE